MTDPQVVPLDRLELTFEPRPWAYAERNRAAIDAFFARLKADKPATWNGRVLLLGRRNISDRVLSGGFFETDFASFIEWRDRGFPEAAAINCFAMAALQAADGAFLLGVMGGHTVNAGRIYFPAGTPDPDDIVGGSVDLDGSVWRELTEETGLGRADVEPDAGWHAVLSGPRIALMKVLRSPLGATALRDRIADWLTTQPRPELGGVHVARGPADLDPMMPDFIRVFLEHVWRVSSR